MTPAEGERVIRQLTDELYRGLFGGTGDELRQRLGLPIEDTRDDDNLRDHMGIEALTVLAKLEETLADLLTSATITSQAELFIVVRCSAQGAGDVARAQCALKHTDFLTGYPIEQETKQ